MCTVHLQVYMRELVCMCIMCRCKTYRCFTCAVHLFLSSVDLFCGLGTLIVPFVVIKEYWALMDLPYQWSGILGPVHNFWILIHWISGIEPQNWLPLFSNFCGQQLAPLQLPGAVVSYLDRLACMLEPRILFCQVCFNKTTWRLEVTRKRCSWT